LSDKNSRIITAYFDLTPLDISQFRFSDLIFFTFDGNDGYYRVNKIFDYDPSITNTTKVELIKASNITIPKSTAYIPEINPPIRINTSYRGLVGNINLSTSNVIDNASTGVIVAGRNNNVGGINNVVIGDNHNVEGTNNVVLGGKAHTTNGNNNVILGSGQGIAVDEDTLAFTTTNEMITYFGQPNDNIIETCTVATYSGIGYSIDGLGRIPLVFVKDLNNDQTGRGIREMQFYISFYDLGTTAGGTGRKTLFSLKLDDLFSDGGLYNGAGSYYISMTIVGSGGAAAPTGFFSGLLEWTLFFNGTTITGSLLQQYFFQLTGWTSGFSSTDINVVASVGTDTFFLFLFDVGAGSHRPTYDTTWGVSTKITYMPY